MNHSGGKAQTALSLIALLFTHLLLAPAGSAHSLNYTVADMRQPGSLSGTTACPQRMRLDISTAGNVSRQWSTSLGASPATILTVDQTPAGRLTEIESSIVQSFAAWTGVSGSALTVSSLSALVRTANPVACAADGVNSTLLQSG